MYELAEPIRIKQLPIVTVPTYVNMLKDHLAIAQQSGVNIGELAVNVYIYESEDPIFLVEYIKMLCNLTKVFRSIYDNELYLLRSHGYIDNKIYFNLNFHNIFNEVNNKFNIYLDNQFTFDEFGIYHSEISLDTSIAMLEVFNDTIILALKDFIDPNLVKFIFNKFRLKNNHALYDEIFNQLENVFLIY